MCKKTTAALLSAIMLFCLCVPAFAAMDFGPGNAAEGFADGNSFTTENGAWNYVAAGETYAADSVSYQPDENEWIYTTNSEDGDIFADTVPAKVDEIQCEDGTVLYAYHFAAADVNGKLASVEVTNEKISRYGIDENGMISVIIELASPSLAASGETLTGGLTQKQASAREALRKEQAEVAERIKAVVSYFEAGYSFTALMNGIEARVPYAELSRVSNVAGVKSVNYMVSFDIPDVSYTAIGTEMDATKMLGANAAVDSQAAWDAGYKGEGMVVAVIDTGIDTDNYNFAQVPAVQRLTLEDIEAAIDSGALNSKLSLSSFTAANAYCSGKIPYVFDYADNDANVNHGGKATSHGTHVAGIVAGNPTEDNIANYGLVSMGVAPEAQIVVMKVFENSNGSCTLSMIAAAIEDAITLGVDAANLSLGAVSGPAYYEGYTEVFDRAADAGISVVCSAGNSFSATYQSLWDYDLGLSSNPDVGILGMPATFDSTLAVASVENPYYFENIAQGIRDAIVYDDNSQGYGSAWRSSYSEKAPVYAQKMAAKLGGDSYEFIILDTPCTQEQLVSIDAQGKLLFAAVSAEVTVDAQATVAQAAGAAGLLLYNPDSPGSFADPTRENWDYPVVGVTHNTIIKYILPSCPDTIYVNPYWNDSDAAGSMSAFSSWGCTEQLTLKPELTAVGGNVTSAYNGNTLARMSGTSMAAPMVSGADALIRQYLKANYELTEDELRAISESLLMSSALPVEYSEGVYYSPRKQGAGLMNIGAAINSGAYITVNGGKPKAELGDDPQKTGNYVVTFTVNNLTNAEKAYNIVTSVQTEDVTTARINPDGSRLYYMLQSPVNLNSTVGGATTVTVPANASLEISVTITLSDADREYMDTYFENGIYVEGFVRLESTDENGTDIGLPFLAFYGSWLDVPVIENNYYCDFADEEKPSSATFAINEAMTYDSVSQTYYYLGASDAWPNNGHRPLGELGNMRYVARRNAVSPNGDGVRDGISELYTSLLRDANDVAYVVRDAETGEEYYRKDMGYCTKTYYSETYDTAMILGIFEEELFDWDYTDNNGVPLPNNAMVYVSVECTKTYNGDFRVHDWTFPLTIDVQNPVTNIEMTYTELEYEEYDEEEDDFVGTGEFYNARTVRFVMQENQYVDWNIIATKKTNSYSHNKTYSNNTLPGMSSGRASIIEHDGSLDNIEYIMYRCSDYAGNGEYVIITYNDWFNLSSIKADNTEIYMQVGETREVNASSDYAFFTEYNLSWMSDDETIASVENANEFTREITANALGTAIITVTNGFVETAEITVHVVDSEYSVTATSNAGGSITPEGITPVDVYGNVTYTITPDEHYHIEDVLIDGESVGTPAEYTFTYMIANHTIEVVFAIDSFTVTYVDGLTLDVLGVEPVPYGETVTPPEAPVHEGYEFTRWIGNTEITEDTVLVAFYSELGTPAPETYTVFFVDGVTGAVISSQIVNTGENAIAPEVPEHEHYEFVEWRGSFTNVTSDSVVVAIYELQYTLGDVNFDGIVNMMDALLIQRTGMGLMVFTDVQCAAGDVNYDYVINSMDSLIVLRHVIGAAMLAE